MATAHFLSEASPIDEPRRDARWLKLVCIGVALVLAVISALYFVLDLGILWAVAWTVAGLLAAPLVVMLVGVALVSSQLE